MKSTGIKTIKVKVGGSSTSMNIDQARNVKAALDRLFDRRPAMMVSEARKGAPVDRIAVYDQESGEFIITP